MHQSKPEPSCHRWLRGCRKTGIDFGREHDPHRCRSRRGLVEAIVISRTMPILTPGIAIIPRYQVRAARFKTVALIIQGHVTTKQLRSPLGPDPRPEPFQPVSIIGTPCGLPTLIVKKRRQTMSSDTIAYACYDELRQPLLGRRAVMTPGVARPRVQMRQRLVQTIALLTIFVLQTIRMARHALGPSNLMARRSCFKIDLLRQQPELPPPIQQTRPSPSGSSHQCWPRVLGKDGAAETVQRRRMKHQQKQYLSYGSRAVTTSQSALGQSKKRVFSAGTGRGDPTAWHVLQT